MATDTHTFQITLKTDVPLDQTDTKILEAVVRNGRITWAELGQQASLSAPAAAERVHRLVARGVIRGFAAIVDAQSIGYRLTAFIAVTLASPDARAGFLSVVDRVQEVLECHHVTGDYDYMLKVRCRDTADLERLITAELKGAGGVQQTRTTIAMSTVKETGWLAADQPPITK